MRRKKFTSEQNFDLKELSFDEMAIVIGGATGTPDDPIPVGKVKVKGNRACSVSDGNIDYSPPSTYSCDFGGGGGGGGGGGFEMPMPDEASRDVYVNFPIGYAPTEQQQQRITETCQMLERLDTKINSYSDDALISMNQSMFTLLGFTGNFEDKFMTGYAVKEAWSRLDIQINMPGTSYVEHNVADPDQRGVPLWTEEGILLLLNIDLIQSYYDSYGGLAGIEFLIAHEFAHVTELGLGTNEQIWRNDDMTPDEKKNNEIVANDLAKAFIEIGGGSSPSDVTYGYGTSIRQSDSPSTSPPSAPWEGGGQGPGGGAGSDVPYQPID